ncbi:MAG: radical SAM protein, partial [Bacteroidales bacterium]|nr:radical SAM protein [Bacteroidales bacterium]
PTALWPQKIKEYIRQIDSKQVQCVAKPSSKQILESQRLIVIPTQACNLGCVYCYARNAHDKSVIELPKFKSAVEMWSNTLKTNGEVSFIGGGEPLYDWELFKECVQIVTQQASKKKKQISISVTTNGTLLTDDRIAWFKENGIRVGVSFDILPEVQNANRPFVSGRETHSVVLGNIKKLIAAGVTNRIRTTINRTCVKLMPEMVQFVVANLEGIESVHFEHVTDASDATDDFYSQFIEYYWQARDVAAGCGLKLRNSVQTSFQRIAYQFCKGELCLTPDGHFVSCHRVSSAKDFGFDDFCFGSVKAPFEHDKVSRIPNLLRNKEQCAFCFCKWHCAGGCPMVNKLLSEDGRLAHCRFVRDFMARMILERIQGERKEVI